MDSFLSGSRSPKRSVDSWPFAANEAADSAVLHIVAELQELATCQLQRAKIAPARLLEPSGQNRPIQLPDPRLLTFWVAGGLLEWNRFPDFRSQKHEC
jgi:hypothetical protein